MDPVTIGAAAQGVGKLSSWWDGPEVSGYAPIYATRDNSNTKIFWVLAIVAVIVLAFVTIKQSG